MKGATPLDDRIYGAIEDATKELFDDVDIIEINVAPKEDLDGDQYLRIEIVIESPEALDKHAITSLARHIRSKLFSIGQSDFPVVSFISKDEAEHLARERA